MVIEFDRETDGRWIAEVEGVPGAIAYGATKEEAAIEALRIANRALVEERTELIRRTTTEQES